MKLRSQGRGRLLGPALITTVLIAAVAAGCGSSGTPTTGSSTGSQTATGFVKQITTQFSLGQAGRLWDSLHPLDQAIVSRGRYMACQSNEGFELRSFKILDTYKDPVDIGGSAKPATAISVRVVSDDGVTTATMHAVRVGSTWRWILAPADVAAYKQGKCPATG